MDANATLYGLYRCGRLTHQQLISRTVKRVQRYRDSFRVVKSLKYRGDKRAEREGEREMFYCEQPARL